MVDKILEAWPHLSEEERAGKFKKLPQDQAEDVFLALTSADQAELLRVLTRAEKRLWIRFLAPDDAADLLQQLESEPQNELMSLIDDKTRGEVLALLHYRQDEAGGLMSTRYALSRPDMLVSEALRYVREQAKQVQPLHFVYVIDNQQKLVGVLSLRQLFVSPADQRIKDIMITKLITVPEAMDQENLTHIFNQHRFVALPVVDSEGRMKGIVTVDDILDVSEEEATEDIQKMGGTEALDAPYPSVGLYEMIRKRGGWLVLLFIGEMFTATAMGFFKHEVEKAVVLSLFIPLIISSGGNSGSQATSLIIRALALRELRIKDWWKVFMKEFVVGLALGVILAAIGMVRIIFWPNRERDYGEHYGLIGFAVGISLIGIVLYGTLIGSMLPFVLKKLKLDPASASAPLVATLVDVTGLVIYFSVAAVVLRGTLL